jgi:hypothetical protein
MATVNAVRVTKTVADPIAEYESLKPLWTRSRAICNGERFAKEYDGLVDTVTYKNLLIPFSPSMTQQQYEFFKAEAELPGVVAQFAKMIVGALLRKQPTLILPEEFDKSIHDWILNEFGQDDSALTAFLDTAIWEELQTSRAWVYIDYPIINNPDALTPEDKMTLKPYPCLWKAEAVINWNVEKDTFGKTLLTRVITREYVKRFLTNEFHPDFIDTVKVHELDENGFYQIRVYERLASTTAVTVVNGQRQAPKTEGDKFELVNIIDNILNNGERLTEIPAWPLNGSIDPVEPMLGPIIDKEVMLYNKMSRRNHLLYGASTYTPIITSDMTDEEFQDIVNSGLGTWIKLRQGDTATVLATPTDALADMDRAIAASIEEMARMGIRMLSPETAQSGIALEIRNASQTAQLGTLNIKVSNTLKQIIVFMINWRLGSNLTTNEVKFELSSDFNPTPVGEAWLRLATEWYQSGLIPRSVWLQMLKQNDMLVPDYDDEQGKMEIAQDQDLQQQQANDAYAQQISQQTNV